MLLWQLITIDVVYDNLGQFMMTLYFFFWFETITYILRLVGWLVGWFVNVLYGISALIGYLILNPIHTYILNIYDFQMTLILFLNEPELFSLHTVKWFQDLLSYTYCSISHQQFVCTLLIGFKFKK